MNPKWPFGVHLISIRTHILLWCLSVTQESTYSFSGQVLKDLNPDRAPGRMKHVTSILVIEQFNH